MGKEEVRIERGRDTLVLGKFTAIASREGMNAHRIGLQHGDHGL